MTRAQSDTTFLTLDQAIEYALTWSPALATADADLNKAQSRIDEALSYCYPQLGFQGTYAYLSNVPVLKVQTGPGTYLQMPMGTHANYDARLSLSQPLYSGGRLEKGYEMARLGVRIAEDSLVRRRQGLIYAVRSAYTNALLLKQLLELTEQSKSLAQEHLRAVEALNEQGYASRYDLLRASLQVENLTPQITRLRNAIGLALDALKLTIGMPLDQQLDVTGELDCNSVDINLEDATAEAVHNRREVAMLDKAIRVTELNRDLIAANCLPTIGAAALYDLKNPSSMGSSGWGSSLTFSLGINCALFDGLKTRAQMRQVEADLRRLKIGRQTLVEAIALEVRDAFSSLASAQASLEATQHSIAIADSGVQLSRARYASGQASNLEVLDAQLALFQAKVNRAQAMRDYAEARARLMKALGRDENE
ncbi:MAG: TolC family protein [candidate division WOR-3 bacterium]